MPQWWTEGRPEKALLTRNKPKLSTYVTFFRFMREIRSHVPLINHLSHKEQQLCALNCFIMAINVELLRSDSSSTYIVETYV